MIRHKPDGWYSDTLEHGPYPTLEACEKAVAEYWQAMGQWMVDDQAYDPGTQMDKGTRSSV